MELPARVFSCSSKVSASGTRLEVQHRCAGQGQQLQDCQELCPESSCGRIDRLVGVRGLLGVSLLCGQCLAVAHSLQASSLSAFGKLGAVVMGL